MFRRISTLLMLGLSISLSSMALAIDIQPNTLYPQVELDTSMGIIVVELDRTRAPITVDNFLTYVVKGHYNNTLFQRVIYAFVVHGGGLALNQEEKP